MIIHKERYRRHTIKIHQDNSPAFKTNNINNHNYSFEISDFGICGSYDLLTAIAFAKNIIDDYIQEMKQESLIVS